ncbi:MAG: hypothetical protein DMF53_07440 [Acidobacteria bacterium]|nr:MAG: hypothetical protein DMF53_07440 [Acidobacteriota bacterium]
MARLSKLVPLALVAGAALLVWRIFFPALMSFDSWVQLRQAWAGRYDDWHPPLMAIVLHQCFRLGRGIGLVTFVQCLAGLLGVRALAAAWLEAVRGPAVPPRRAGWIAAGVALLLLLSPLPFYLATFWKDSWAAVILVWVCALSLRALPASCPPRPHPLAPSPLRGEGERGSGNFAALALLAVLLGLVRHNAIVVLPVTGLVLAVALWRRSRAAGVVLALAPLIACLLAERAIDAAFDVQPRHLERLMMVFDLAGVCAEDARACAELPYARRQAGGGDLAGRYVPGDMGRSFPHGILVREEDAAALRGEYLRALRRFPGLLARVKVEAFAPLLDPNGARMVIYRGLDANEFGLRLNPRFAAVRERWTRAMVWAGEQSPLLRPLVGSHLIWFLLNVLGIGLLLASPGRRSLALVLLQPLAFSLSYLLATPEPDYRFLYPSTLVIQCVALSWMLGWALGGTLQKPTGRAP